jgi:hypothetical protein
MQIPILADAAKTMLEAFAVLIILPGLTHCTQIPILADVTKAVSARYGTLKRDAGIALRGLYIINPEVGGAPPVSGNLTCMCACVCQWACISCGLHPPLLPLLPLVDYLSNPMPLCLSARCREFWSTSQLTTSPSAATSTRRCAHCRWAVTYSLQ